MALVLKQIFATGSDEIAQNYTIESWHVSQSVDAFTGQEAYDVTISGSLNLAGSTLTGSTANITSITGSLLGTSSWATNALTVSYALGASGSLTGSLFGTSSWAESASQALTASYVTGSIFTSTNPALSASYALTASYAANAGGTFNSTSSVIGNGLSSSFNINHGFNTRNLHITVYESSSNGETVYPDIRRINENTASIIFANPPTSNQYIVYISQ